MVAECSSCGTRAAVRCGLPERVPRHEGNLRRRRAREEGVVCQKQKTSIT